MEYRDVTVVAGHLEHAMKRMVNKYNGTHFDQLCVTPHVLRHTFCTRMTRAGVPVKICEDMETYVNVDFKKLQEVGL